MIGILFELLKGLPHEADQFSMENVRRMTILNLFFRFRAVLASRRLNCPNVEAAGYVALSRVSTTSTGGL